MHLSSCCWNKGLLEPIIVVLIVSLMILIFDKSLKIGSTQVQGVSQLLLASWRPCSRHLDPTDKSLMRRGAQIKVSGLPCRNGEAASQEGAAALQKGVLVTVRLRRAGSLVGPVVRRR